MKKAITDSLLYVLMFAAIQIAVGTVTQIVCQTEDVSPIATIVCSIVSSVLAIALFAWRKWTPMPNHYISQRPWFTLFWVICLAGGSVMPMTFAIEQAGIDMPEGYAKLFKGIMSHDSGFLAVGVLAPIAEEMVFRGAILRRLIDVLDVRWHWAAIVVTAALFGAIHLNMAQGINAFVMGLLLGWMYMRTRSIVPGLVFHFTNNTIAFFSYRFFPYAADKTLVEFYGGNMNNVLMAVAFSLMIFGAALYQLSFRLQRGR